MALALSLSLDLFLMKGNLLIAVRAQPAGRTDGRTGEERDRRQSSAKEVEEKKPKGKKKKEEEGTEQRDVVNVVTERVRGEMHWAPEHSTHQATMY